MYKKNKVAVLMAVKNGEEYLEESIESILSQTFKNFKFLIIDNGSSDSSKEIIKKYNKIDDRLELIELGPVGLTKSLNYGIRYLQVQKYNKIFRMDADDIAMPDRISKQLKYAELKNADLYFMGAKYFNGKKVFQVPNFLIKEYLLVKNNLIHPTVMINIHNEQCYEKFLYDETMTSAQDYESWTRGKTFEVIREVGIKYRVHPKQISISSKDEQFDNHLKISYRNLSIYFINVNKFELRKVLRGSGDNIVKDLINKIKFVLNLKRSKDYKCSKLKLFLSLIIP